MLLEVHLFTPLFQTSPLITSKKHEACHPQIPVSIMLIIELMERRWFDAIGISVRIRVRIHVAVIDVGKRVI